MSIYSALHEKDSVMKQAGFRLLIPGGTSTLKTDWYPFPMIFNAGEFAEGTKMSIIYNFPAFNPLDRASNLFDEDSEYNSAFYGAYIITKDDSTPYGFSDNWINTEELTSAFEYDYVNLVLKSFRSKNFVFTPVHYETTSVDYLGYSDWIMVDAIIKTNGVSHNSIDFKRSYIQYGNPGQNTSEDFPIVTLFGKLYLRYFEEYNCTIAMYIMAVNEKVILECDKNILSKTIIR